MRKVVLHGRLKRLFGGPYSLAVETAGEAIRALNANFPKAFAMALKEGSYEVVRGNRRTGMRLDLEEINPFRLGTADLHIIPVTAGSKNGGALKAILGVALIGVAIFASGGTLAAPLAGLTGGGLWGSVAFVGLGMVLTGVSQMLTKKEKPKDEAQKENSFSINGPANFTEQGNPVPLIYGRCMVGSIPASFALDIEDIGAYKLDTGGSQS